MPSLKKKYTYTCFTIIWFLPVPITTSSFTALYLLLLYNKGRPELSSFNYQKQLRHIKTHKGLEEMADKVPLVKCWSTACLCWREKMTLCPQLSEHEPDLFWVLSRSWSPVSYLQHQWEIMYKLLSHMHGWELLLEVGPAECYSSGWLLLIWKANSQGWVRLLQLFCIKKNCNLDY